MASRSVCFSRGMGLVCQQQFRVVQNTVNFLGDSKYIIGAGGVFHFFHQRAKFSLGRFAIHVAESFLSCVQYSCGHSGVTSTNPPKRVFILLLRRNRLWPNILYGLAHRLRLRNLRRPHGFLHELQLPSCKKRLLLGCFCLAQRGIKRALSGICLPLRADGLAVRDDCASCCNKRRRQRDNRRDPLRRHFLPLRPTAQELNQRPELVQRRSV